MEKLMAEARGIAEQLMASLWAPGEEAEGRRLAEQNFTELAEFLSGLTQTMRAVDDVASRPFLEWRGGKAYCRPEWAGRFPAGTMGIGRVPVMRKGQASPAYYIEQTLEEMAVVVKDEAQGLRESDLRVLITRLGVQVLHRDAVLLSGPLWEPVDAQRSTWEVVGGELVLTLKKELPDGAYGWPHLLRDTADWPTGKEHLTTSKREYEANLDKVEKTVAALQRRDMCIARENARELLALERDARAEPAE